MFHVFIEGPAEPSPAAAQRLADTLEQRYGLRAADVLARLHRGRFRVKANLDLATANAYARELAQLGARIAIDETDGPIAPRGEGHSLPPATTGRPSVHARFSQAKVRPTTPPPYPPEPALASPLPAGGGGRPVSPSLPPGGGRPTPTSLPPWTGSRPTPTSLPPGGGGRPMSPSLPPAGAGRQGPTDPPFATGLAAAFAGGAPEASLGALARDEGMLSLASLDGHTTEANPLAYGGLVGDPAPAAAARRPATPLDLFAPPDARAAQRAVELAPDEIAHRAHRRMSLAPAAEAESEAGSSVSGMTEPQRSAPSLWSPQSPARASAASIAPHQPAGRASAASLSPPPAIVAPSPGRGRWRFAAGVAAAIVLGFVPAHVVASLRERAVDRAIDGQVAAAHARAESAEAYATLDATRASLLDRKRSQHRSIALLSLLIWVAAGTGVAYVWFRRLPWDGAPTRS